MVSKKPYTEEEVREIAERHGLVGFPHLALVRERLSVKAKSEPKFRFYNLYGHVVETETLKCAWRKVRANDGAAGVDGVTIEDIEQSEGGVEGFIAEIQRELHEKTYRASPVRRAYIEKENGKMRPLGIPTIKDRVVQNAVLLVVEPIYEADFHDCSYGFRPGRSAQQAVDRIAEEVKAGKLQVYDADLTSYFDTIPHDKLFLAMIKIFIPRKVCRNYLSQNVVQRGVFQIFQGALRSIGYGKNGCFRNIVMDREYQIIHLVGGELHTENVVVTSAGSLPNMIGSLLGCGSARIEIEIHPLDIILMVRILATFRPITAGLGGA